MQAALAEVNATRPKTSHTRTLADARLAYRVAIADARDEYERALERAAADAAVAQRNAVNALAVARGRARAVSRARRDAWQRARYMEEGNLVFLVRNVNMMLSPESAPFQDPDKRPELVCMQRMLVTLLHTRGVEL